MGESKYVNYTNFLTSHGYEMITELENTVFKNENIC
jgi:hypothetical protein